MENNDKPLAEVLNDLPDEAVKDVNQELQNAIVGSIVITFVLNILAAIFLPRFFRWMFERLEQRMLKNAT